MRPPGRCCCGVAVAGPHAGGALRNPAVDMIVTDGDVSPEGVKAYQYRGDFYLAIANEVSNTTTLYSIERPRRKHASDD